MPPKFGLIKMQGFAKGAGLKGSGAAKPKPAVLKPAAFRFCGGDDDDEEDSVARADEDDDAKDRRAARGLRGAAGVDVRGVNASLVQLQAHSSAAAERLKQQALAADANVFAYDELYDDMQANRTDKQANRAKDFDPSSGQAGRKESRYIEQLKKSADIRKVDDERLFQMKLKKEADAEAHIYGDKEKFVTAAYKEKLAEMGRWKDEDARLQAAEAATTVEGKLSMSGFYANLLTKNLAMGTGDVAKDATSAYTIGSKRNEHIRQLEAAQKQDGDTKRGSCSSGGGSGGGDDDDEAFDEEALLRRTEAAEGGHKRKHDEADGDAGAAASAAASATAFDDAAAAAASAASSAASSGAGAAPPPQHQVRVVPPEAQPQSLGAAVAAAEKASAASAEAAAAVKAEKAAAVAAARERFLARKKVKPT